jgi:hypothetical protein
MQTQDELPPSPKSESMIGGIIFAIMIIVAIAVIAVRSQTGPAPSAHMVTYELIGVGAASITIQNETGGTEQHQVKIWPGSPWKKNFLAADGTFVYLSAQLNRGRVNAAIYVDDKLIQHAETVDDYSIVTVSGTVR